MTDWSLLHQRRERARVAESASHDGDAVPADAGPDAKAPQRSPRAPKMRKPAADRDVK